MTKTARRGMAAASPGKRLHYYDYRQLRPGRGVTHYEPDLIRALGVHGDRGEFGPAGEIALMVTSTGADPLDVVADHFVVVPRRVATAEVAEGAEVVLRRAVEQVLDDWFKASAHQASMRQAAKHPSFGLLEQVGPFATAAIAKRLRVEPNALWVWALGELTGEDPAEGVSTVADAIAAWIAWADERGL